MYMWCDSSRLVRAEKNFLGVDKQDFFGIMFLRETSKVHEIYKLLPLSGWIA